VDVQKDDNPNDGDEEKGENEDVPPLVIIGGDSDDHTQPKRDGPRRDRIELSLDRTVAERSDDGGGEEGIAIPRNDEAEVHETTEEDLEILEDTEDIPPSRPSVELGVTNILSEPGLDEGPLFLRQPLGFLREVRGEKEHDNGTSNSQETL